MLVGLLVRAGYGVTHEILTVTVSPEPTFITESGSLRMESLNSLMSFLVHIEAAAMGGSSSIKTQMGTEQTCSGHAEKD